MTLAFLVQPASHLSEIHLRMVFQSGSLTQGHVPREAAASVGVCVLRYSLHQFQCVLLVLADCERHWEGNTLWNREPEEPF